MKIAVAHTQPLIILENVFMVKFINSNISINQPETHKSEIKVLYLTQSVSHVFVLHFVVLSERFHH